MIKRLGWPAVRHPRGFQCSERLPDQRIVGVAHHADHWQDSDQDDQEGGERAFLEISTRGELVEIRSRAS